MPAQDKKLGHELTGLSSLEVGDRKHFHQPTCLSKQKQDLRSNKDISRRLEVPSAAVVSEHSVGSRCPARQALKVT